MIGGMKRNLRWLIFAGGVIVVLGVLWQAFSIAAYIRGAGDSALDAQSAARSSCTSGSSRS